MAGPWEKYGGRGIPIGPQDPTQDLKRPAAMADIQSKQAGMANEGERLRMERERLDLARQDHMFKMQEAARAREEQARLAQQRVNAQADAESELFKTLTMMDRTRADGSDGSGWFETGYTGSKLRDVPGTAAYDLGKGVESIQANLAFDRLQRMRELSPTGGALGNVSNIELDLLKSSVGNIDPNQSQDTFLRNVDFARGQYEKTLERVNPQASRVRRMAPEQVNRARQTGEARLSQETAQQFQKYLRENPGASPAQREVFLKTLQETAQRNFQSNPDVRVLRPEYAGRRPQRSAVAGAPRKPTAGGGWKIERVQD
jgi:hypothetical protein